MINSIFSRKSEIIPIRKDRLFPDYESGKSDEHCREFIKQNLRKWENPVVASVMSFVPDIDNKLNIARKALMFYVDVSENDHELVVYSPAGIYADISKQINLEPDEFLDSQYKLFCFLRKCGDYDSTIGAASRIGVTEEQAKMLLYYGVRMIEAANSAENNYK